MKSQKIMSYYCKKCSDIAKSYRDETFSLKPSICSKHKVALIPYRLEEMLDDLDEASEAIRDLFNDK